MDLKEYFKKLDNIETMHPYPVGMTFPESNWHYRKIINKWKLELSDSNRVIVDKRDLDFA